ncbi:hypothetical protein RND71_010690 [Anisodus tanguticus]|uniref:Uncharacterized protein n=1 Tax=Anisodus tanguticus TaxID=243964 RepID=A0AAE1VSW4_9SOLA|nr:hypothetical protein RND71_010690 [Anisodus tanguticus]
MMAEDASRPWNLRTRRAVCKAPMNGITVGGSSQVRTDQNESPRLRSEFAVAGAGDTSTGEKKRSVSLGRKEI